MKITVLEEADSEFAAAVAYYAKELDSDNDSRTRSIGLFFGLPSIPTFVN